MARRAKGASSSERPAGHSGGDAARDLYDELTDDLLYDPAIGRATMMGHPCVRLAGKFVASCDNKTGALIVKLPGDRVTALVDSGAGAPFAPAGKVLREWVAIPAIDGELWRTLLAEAVTFARKSLETETDR